MAKSPELYGFYTPHKRVIFDGLILNRVTGEYTKPVPRTKQEFKRECDINNIIAAFKVTGIVNHISAKASQGQYVDLPGDLDFQASVEMVRRANDAFLSLPSKVRDRFGNDPARFLSFLEDPANLAESYELGLRTRPRAPEGAPDPAPEAQAAQTPPAS